MSGTRRFSEILSMIVGGGGAPLAIILPEFFGVKGVYLAESVADATAAICCLTIFMIFSRKYWPKAAENEKILNFASKNPTYLCLEKQESLQPLSFSRL